MSLEDISFWYLFSNSWKLLHYFILLESGGSSRAQWIYSTFQWTASFATLKSKVVSISLQYNDDNSIHNSPLYQILWNRNSFFCEIQAQNYFLVGHTMKDVRYKWNNGLNSVQISSDVSLPQFKVLGHRQKLIEASLSSGRNFLTNFSISICKLYFDLNNSLCWWLKSIVLYFSQEIIPDWPLKYNSFAPQDIIFLLHTFQQFSLCWHLFSRVWLAWDMQESKLEYQLLV